MAEPRPELQWLARERYCLDRKSFAEVAGELKVAEKTVRDWAAKGDWRAEREALAEAEARIRIDTIKCRALVLQKLLDGGADLPRLASAAVELERLHREKAAKGAPDPAPDSAWMQGLAAPEAPKKRPRRARVKDADQDPAAFEASCAPAAPDAAFSEPDSARAAAAGELEELAPQERIRLLELAVNRQLSHVLSRPVEDLSKRVKEIKAALDILETMKGREAENKISVSFED